MFKQSKLLKIIIIIAIILSLMVLITSLISLKDNTEKVINKSIDIAYKEKEKELKNYVTLAYKTIKSYHTRTANNKIKHEVKLYIEEQSDYLFSIINSEYEKNKNLVPKQELKHRIKSIIKSVRYGKAGYFWINDFNYNMIMHPIKEDLTGGNFENRDDVPFVKLGVNKLNKIGKESAFIEYPFYSPRSKQTVFKSSLVKVFKPYNWIIGTGVYLDDVTEVIKEEALKAISQMKYGKNGYFWIIDSNHNLLMDGAKADFPNKSRYDVKNSNGIYIYREIVKSSNSNLLGAFVRYAWTDPSRKGEFEKLSFVKKFEAWDFIIGTGVYIDEIEENSLLISKEADNNILYVIVIIFLFLIMIYLIITLLLNNQKIRETDKKLRNKTTELDSSNKNLEEKVLNRTIEIEGQKVVLQSIIDSQNNMLVVTDFKNISFTNDSFLKFFAIKDIKEFDRRFNTILDSFCDFGEYLHEGKLNNMFSEDSIGKEFYNLVTQSEEDKRVVIILDKNLEVKSFFINMTIIDKDNELFLVSLTDITKITVEKNIAEKKAYIDGLTGIANRNKFNKVFDKELNRSKRYNKTFSMVLIDVDKFKDFNDKYGHMIGDEVLIMLARGCEHKIRKIDFFARWGGEEFILLFPETNLHNAVKSAQKLRNEIQNIKHKTAGSITCSFGVTAYKTSDDLNSMFKRCDRMLYTAKENGRNRVESI